MTGSQYPSTNWACATAAPAAGALENTQYNYDANGNLLTVTDPLAHLTTNTYDALNRLTRVVDPASGQTSYTYNANSALVQVTDPRTLNTVYTLDGFGQTTLLNSPDTGITYYSSYDAAGNLWNSPGSPDTTLSPYGYVRHSSHGSHSSASSSRRVRVGLVQRFLRLE